MPSHSPPRRARSRRRAFLRLFAPLAALALAAALLFLWTLRAAELDRRRDAAATEIALVATAMEQSMAPPRHHLRSLQAEPPVRAALEDPTPEHLAAMAQALRSLLSRNPAYMLAGWIGPDGRERLRFNSDGTLGGGYRVPDDALQDKSDRYYVRETLRRPPGTIYLSPLDLNVEQGRIETPQRPVIRLATALDRSRGMLVINIDGHLVLDALRAAPTATVWLLNEEGDFLRSPSPADDFSFMFGRRTTLGDRHPALWRQVAAEPSGTWRADGKLWVWRRVDPLAATLPGPALPASVGPRWILLSALDTPAPGAMAPSEAAAGALVLLFCLGVIGALSWRVASGHDRLQAARAQTEQASRAKSEFLANMSHEIRTPMNAIVGLARILVRAPANDEQAARLARLDQAARHLLALLNDILDMAKLDANAVVLEERDLALRSLLDSVVSLVGGQAQAKGLPIEIDTGDVPAWLKGDPTRLRQALVNYLGNAIKFTEHGHVGIATRLVRRDGDRLRIRFTVSDTGPGVEPDVLARLFQPFEQADASVTRRHGGTGLGLVIVRRLAALMGGSAGADSVPGVGSSFWFEAEVGLGTALADQPSGPNLLEVERRLIERHAGARVMLVEDNEVNREVALELLHRAGLNVHCEGDGRAAVAAALRQAFDLVLMDMQMPELDGPAATREIRRLPGHATTPILAMTANAFDADRQECIAAGMNDFIVKPVDPDVLYRTLLRWLPAHPPATPADTARAAPDTSDRDLRQRLGGIPGLDAALGLRSIGGNGVLYLRLLRMLARTHAGTPAALRDAVARGDIAGLGMLTHSLAGALGQVGAVRVAQLATRSDAALRRGEPLDDALHASLETLAGDLAQLVQALRDRLADDASRTMGA